jgi:hypothetical protein
MSSAPIDNEYHGDPPDVAHGFPASDEPRKDIARVSNAMYEQPGLPAILAAVVAAIAWQDQQGVEFGYITGDHVYLGVQIHNAAVACREALRLKTGGAT